MAEVNEQYRRGRIAEAVENDLQSHISVLDEDAGTFSYEGRYTLSFSRQQGRYVCECLGFAHRGFCKHVAALMVRVSSEPLPRKPDPITFTVGGSVVGHS